MSRSARPAQSPIEADWRSRLQEAQTLYWQALDHHQLTLEELNRCLDNGRYEKARANHDIAFKELLKHQEALIALLRNPVPTKP